MYSIRRKALLMFLPVLAATLMATISCTPGVQSGSINGQFAGVQSAKAVSPTAVVLNWTKVSEFPAYEVYTTGGKAPIAESVFSTATIESLSPDTSYAFKVTAKGSTGVGSNVESSVRTWPRFTGISRVFKNSDGGMVVEWSYNYPAETFEIFYQADSPPTAQSTNNWARPNATSNGTSYTFKGLSGSTTYYFTVHARYREGEYERPSKSIAGATNSSFPAPYFELPKITIGALPTIDVQPVVTDQFPAGNYESRVYKDDVEVADPIRGAGKATFASTIPLPLGKVDNITLKVTYKDAKVNETLSLPGLSTYLKGTVPYLDLPPVTAQMGPAYLGGSSVSGDFNCDGYDDLAIGLPRVALASLGVVNSLSGAVYIYYGGLNSNGQYVLKTTTAPSINPEKPGEDPQILTFPDLNYNARFGQSLAKGNLNGDSNGIYSCDDLAVGAPEQYDPDGRPTGNVFVFFGTAKVGLKAPATISAFPQNSETCDGRTSGATCTAVRLWPDYRLWPRSALGNTSYAPSFWGNGGWIQFGAAVSFVGDFNADGNEDLAIGAPNAPWDGVRPDYVGRTDWTPDNVGFVAMYFGSKFGLGFESPTATATEKFRWLKIFPPIVQPGMRFGASLAGGDVDGAYRVRDNSGKYVGGADLVVGAPSFSYNDPNNSLFYMTSSGPDNDYSITPAGGGWWGTDTNRQALTNPRYKFSQNNATNQGAAFVFFGRSLGSHSLTNNINNPSISSFWSCGRRGMQSYTEHFSCLGRADNFRILFPRDNTSSYFGTSVAVIGDKSARDANDDLKCAPATTTGPQTPVASGPCRDANGDSFGDIIVLAPYADSSDGRSRTGALWQFFGNSDRLYEAGGSNDAFKPTLSPPANFFNTAASCQNFALSVIPTAFNNWPADKVACSPTKLIPNSTLAGSYMGLYPGSISVGDVTRDGLYDIVVGATGDSTQGVNAGATYVFTSLRGAGITSNLKKFIRNTSNDSDRFGYATAIGDFDALDQNQELSAYTCDSEGNVACDKPNVNYNSLPFKDVAVGAPYEDADRPSGGGMHLFNSGYSVLPAVRTTSDVDIYDTLASMQGFGYGESRIVGDINGDGYDDAVTHIQGYSSAGATTYDAVVYFGSAYGLVTTQFCLQNEDRVFMNSGHTSECYPARSHMMGITNADILLPQKLVRPNNVSPGWGRIGFNAGDVNGDGFADVVFYDPAYDGGYNAQILVYYGTRAGLQDVVIPSWRPANNDPQIVSRKVGVPDDWYYSNYGELRWDRTNVVQAGDFNGDGYSDIVVTNSQAQGPNLITSKKIKEQFTGVEEDILDISGWPTNSKLNGTIWRCPDNSNLSGECVNGSGPRFHGMLFIFYGSSQGVATPAMYTAGTGTIDLTTAGVKLNLVYGTEDKFGVVDFDAIKGNVCAASLSPTNGCVPLVSVLRNPVLVNFKNGHYMFEHYFGASVVPIKINKNDTFDSLVVSAPGYENLNCYASGTPEVLDQGRLYVFRGSKAGLVAGAKTDYYPTPSTATGDPTLCAGISTDADTGLGLAAAEVGRLRALRMSMAPYPTTPEQTAAGAGGNLNSRTRRFGWRMANGGDVNGDGFEDLIVTAPYENVYDQNGSVVRGAGAGYMFYGPLCPSDNDKDVQTSIQSQANLNKQLKYNDTGLGVVASACAGKTLAPQKFRVSDVTPPSGNDSGSSNIRYGISVAGGRVVKDKQTGDVNLDGYADIVIGGPYWNDLVNSANGVGRGVIFFGSPGGLFTDEMPSPVVEKLTQNRVKPYVLRPPVSISGNYFFLGNVSTGDVNGDRSLDVMTPSFDYDGVSPLPGIDLGAFFLFY